MGRLIHKSIKWLGFFILFIAAGAFMYSRQNDPIVGTWIGIHETSTKSKMVFTNNHKMKVYYQGHLKTTENYKLSSTPHHCDADMSKRLKQYPGESILITTNPKTGEKHCALVYKLTENRLIYKNFRDFTSGIDTLKKVQQ